MPENETAAGVLLPVTLQEARDQVGDDLPNEANDRLLTRLIKLADKYLEGALAADYDRTDERARQLALYVVDEWFNAGAKTQKVSAAIEKMVNDFTFQLKMEARRAAANGSTETDPYPTDG